MNASSESLFFIQSRQRVPQERREIHWFKI